MSKGIEVPREEFEAWKRKQNEGFKWPHLLVFGGQYDNHIFNVRFVHDKDTDEWTAAFLGEEDEPIDELTITRATPRDAFFAVVERHTLLNGGVETNLVRNLKEGWESCFKADGFPIDMSEM